jgi:hypothetical protein
MARSAAEPCQGTPRAYSFGEYVVRAQIARLALALCACATISACRHDVAGKNTWIRGDSHERWTTVGRHLRGLDVAMVEIGYRYQELYWAGVDSNWEYADYQSKKIDLALENALERRPKRRASAETLFVPALAEVEEAIASREGTEFSRAFEGMSAACNSCHAAEGVATFHVEAPTVRTSSIRAPR